MKRDVNQTTQRRNRRWACILLVLLAACGSSDDDGGDNPPTLIVRGGTILTGDADEPVVEAMAIRNDEIVAVGSAADIDAMAAPETEVLDLDGNTALPGFIESHGHYAQNSFPMHLVFLPAPSKPELLAALAAEVDNEPDKLLVLSGWLPVDYSGTREELDAISITRPIVVVALDGHGLWLNSTAIELAGIPEPAEEPLYPGATLRDDGTYDGSFVDFRWSVFVTMAIIDQTPPEVLRANILNELRGAAAVGITSVLNMSFSEPSMRALVDLAKASELPVRIREVYLGTDPRSTDYAHALPSGVDSDWFRIQGVKYFLDGAPFSGTAAFAEGSSSHSAPLLMKTEELSDRLREAAERDEQVLVHATGHQATHQALDALEQAGERVKKLRFRIEHADVFYPDDLARLAGVITSLQPPHFPPFAPPDTESLYPPAEENGQLRYLNAGATVVLGAENSVPPTVWLAMSMIGPTPEEAFTFDQALTASTSQAAYAMFDEDRTGTLAPGFLADFTVVNADPRNLSPEEIFALQVVRTVIGGRTQYVAE
jgi:predicted amidohydrolase YtcJ